MRVIAGRCGGRPLKSVPGRGTRPTSDKVKESVFNIIGPYFQRGWALDLFAGTGALGIEALSRGMERAVFVDSDTASMRVVQANLDALGIAGQAETYRNDAARAVKLLAKTGRRFALVFLDPPYKNTGMDRLMLDMAECGLIEREGVVVVEHSASVDYPEQVGALRRFRMSRYGDTAVSIYRMEEEADEGRRGAGDESSGLSGQL